MANALYDTGRNAFLQGQINWVLDNISAVLVDTASYTVDLVNHQYLSDIPLAARTATAALTGKTAVAGVADAADTTFLNVTGPQSEALVLYKDTGIDTTSQLIAYIDTAVGLPVTPSGGDIVILWDNGTNKIFKL